MDNRRLKRYVALAIAKKQAETDLDEIKEKMRVLEEYMMDNMAKSGQQSIRINGHTVYLHRQLWAAPANGADHLHIALKAEGYGDLVEPKINSQRLSALVREFERDEEGMPIMPGGLHEAIKVTEKYSVRVRKTN